MSKVIQRGAVTPSMNITPLIDVVFLLIIFFMLVNNIVSEESESMMLPTLEDPRTREIGEIERVVVNVVPEPFTESGRDEFPLNHPGRPAYVKVGTGADSRFDIDDLKGIAGALKLAKAANPKIEVLLRVDGAIYYDRVQPIMAAIVKGAKIETVNLVAYLPEE